MDENDDRLAVLFALKGANGTQVATTSHRLFERLPKVLRTRWSEGYLTEAVLRELAQEDLVSVRAVPDGHLTYALTKRGANELAPRAA